MNFYKELSCPVCKSDLMKEEKCLKCEKGHSFDIAKEGYVNLLTASHKSGDLLGDNKSMALSRQNFLNKGYFSSLSSFLSDYAKKHFNEKSILLDICCGEGYYSSEVLKENKYTLYGFDLSKSMVRLGAKRRLPASFFVANLSRIPLKDESIDFAFHLFAPFHEKEFSRILKKDGRLLTVVPGENHLFELKEAIYEKPYKNDEKLPEADELILKDTFKVKEKITLTSKEDIESLFMMTPYYYRTSQKDKEKLQSLDSLEVTVEFVVGEYGRKS